MQLFSNSTGPRVQVAFHTSGEHLTKIALSSSSSCKWLIPKDSSLKEIICHFMESYCAKNTLPKLPLDLSSLPPFTKQILLILSEIKKPTTYKQLAVAANNPKAFRAVGTACNKNPYPLVIPCHLVVNSGGKLGGFAYGQAIKREILTFEHPRLARSLLPR